MVLLVDYEGHVTVFERSMDKANKWSTQTKRFDFNLEHK